MLQNGNIDLNEIHSFTDFLRNAKAHAKRLKKTGSPSVLTVNGKAELVVQDVKSYQALLSDLGELEDYRAVLRGIEDMRKGRGQPMDAVFDALEAKYLASAKKAEKRK